MTYPAKKRSSCLQNLEHAMPMYTRVGFDDLDTCHRTVQSGQPLSDALANRDEIWLKTAYEQSLRADQMLDEWRTMPDEALVQVPLEPLDDFCLATLGCLLFDRYSCVQGPLSKALQKRSAEAQIACLLSPEGSPLVDYDWMFSDVLGYDLVDDGSLYEDLMMRSLAHNLRYQNGKNAIQIISYLAADRLACGELDSGLELYLKLLKAYGNNFNVLESAALEFGRIGFAKVSWRLAHEAGRVSAQLGKHRHAVEDLMMMIPNHRKETPRNAVEDFALGAVEAVLKRSSLLDTGPSPLAFTEELFPEIDDVPVKRMPVTLAAR